MSQLRNNLIVRNSLLNFSGQLIPLIVGAVAIPFVIRGLGVENFGILSLAWMLLGYFTVFDLGMGRATTKFISEEIRNGSAGNLRDIFWKSCWINLFLGLGGGIIIGSLSTVLAEKIFKITPALTHEANIAFTILASSCPLVLVSLTFRGTLEAAQRFEYINVVAIIASSLNYVLPLVGIYAGLGVRGIVFLLMIARLCSALSYFFLCLKVFPELRKNIPFNLKRTRRMLLYGGWVSVSNIVNPILIYLDRFLIGSIISMAAVAYYTAPYEMVSRVSILPTSLAMTLFPSFSAIRSDEREGLTSLCVRSTKALFLLMGILVAVLIFLANDILRLWLGSQFADISTTLVQILLVGILMNSLAQIPYALIQGLGRPDITAKLHLIELVFYIPMALFFVKTMGLVGGAIACTIRVSVDSILLFIASTKFINIRIFLDNALKRCAVVVSLSICLLFGASLLSGNIFVKLVVSGILLLLYSVISWRYVLNIAEKEMLITIVHQSVSGMRRSRQER